MCNFQLYCTRGHGDGRDSGVVDSTRLGTVRIGIRKDGKSRILYNINGYRLPNRIKSPRSCFPLAVSVSSLFSTLVISLVQGTVILKMRD